MANLPQNGDKMRTRDYRTNKFLKFSHFQIVVQLILVLAGL